jgi:hypothetical protein
VRFRIARGRKRVWIIGQALAGREWPAHVQATVDGTAIEDVIDCCSAHGLRNEHRGEACQYCEFSGVGKRFADLFHILGFHLLGFHLLGFHLLGFHLLGFLEVIWGSLSSQILCD